MRSRGRCTARSIYYPQGPDAFAAARKDHDGRIERVRAVSAEFFALADGIADGGHKAVSDSMTPVRRESAIAVVDVPADLRRGVTRRIRTHARYVFPDWIPGQIRRDQN